MYFYQLGLRLTLAKLHRRRRVASSSATQTGIDLPNESQPRWPYAVEYFDQEVRAQGWTNAVTLNLAIGQGENSQTVVNMARFYTALATDGHAATPSIAQPDGRATQDLRPDAGAAGRVARGDGGRGLHPRNRGQRADPGSGDRRQDGHGAERSQHRTPGSSDSRPARTRRSWWRVLLEGGQHGYLAARVASKIIEHYLKRPAIEPAHVEGG